MKRSSRLNSGSDAASDFARRFRIRRYFRYFLNNNPKSGIFQQSGAINL